MDQAFGFIRPRDINDAGAIVGLSQGVPGTGFYWDEVEGRQILSNILTDPMWRVTDALAINDEGWILANGEGTRKGSGIGVFSKRALAPRRFDGDRS